MKRIAPFILISILLVSCQNFMSSDIEPVDIPAGVENLETAFIWVSTNIEFVDDFRPIWQGPHTTLKLRTGNCEAMAILLSTICNQLGYNSGLVICDGGKHAISRIDGMYYDCTPILSAGGYRPATFAEENNVVDITYNCGIYEVLANCDSD
jgi:hypothetical protein